LFVAFFLITDEAKDLKDNIVFSSTKDHQNQKHSNRPFFLSFLPLVLLILNNAKHFSLISACTNQ
jgi:hypothetical protein